MAETQQSGGLDPIHLQDLGDPPGWPKVIGILSIIWGSLGVTCAGCGLVILPILPSLLGKPGEPLPPTMHIDPMSGVLYVLGIAQAVLLIVAGVMTLRRVAAGRWLHLLYAAAGFALLPFGLYVTWRKNQLMGQWVQDNPSSPFVRGYKPGAGTFGLIVQGVLGMAWPLFTLIWFGMVKRTVGSMHAGGREPMP